MKTKLPKRSKSHEADIQAISDIIVKSLGDKLAFVILFGSFARGDWVHDVYVEDGITYEFASDYDFLLVMKKSKYASGHTANNLKERIIKKLEHYMRPYKNHSPTIIIEPIERINKELEKGQYFFSDIKKEGVLLYDSGEFELAQAKELSKEEQQQIAKEHFEQWFSSSNEFLIDGKNAFDRESFKKTAFELHQATESLLNCALLVLTGYKPKSHDIAELLKLCASQSNEFLSIFPTATAYQKECFELLQKAYIEARYSKDYLIDKSQLKYLLECVEKLSKIVINVCKKKID